MPEFREGADIHADLRAFILALGSDVREKPPRSNSSVVYARSQDFVTLIQNSRGVRIDVLAGGRFRDGVRVPGDVSVNRAKKLIAEAYELAR